MNFCWQEEEAEIPLSNLTARKKERKKERNKQTNNHRTHYDRKVKFHRN